jgi:hypothetical protein
MWRDFDTGDSTNDIKLVPGTDFMLVPVNRAQLWIDKSSFPISMKVPGPENLLIQIVSGGTSLAASAVILSALLSQVF